MDNTSTQSTPIAIQSKLGKLNIAIIKELINGSDHDVTRTVYSASEKFRDIGYSCDEVSIKMWIMHCHHIIHLPVRRLAVILLDTTIFDMAMISQLRNTNGMPILVMLEKTL